MECELFDIDKWKSGKYICQTIAGAIVKDITINKDHIYDCYALEVEFEDCNDISIIPSFKNYYKNGIWNVGTLCTNDLILIKKENNMETKELKIIPPKGYVIYKENSTFDCIKFKSIIKWRDDISAKFNGYYIGSDAEIIDVSDIFNTEDSYNVFATEKQAKSALAMARISQIMANDERFGGVVSDEEWDIHSMKKYCITRDNNTISCNT